MKTKILLICLLSLLRKYLLKIFTIILAPQQLVKVKTRSFCEGKYFIAHVNHLNNKSEGIEFTKMFNRNPSVAQYEVIINIIKLRKITF